MELIECGMCNGTGIAECVLEWGSDECPNSCPACGGEQEHRCPACDGTGKEE